MTTTDPVTQFLTDLAGGSGISSAPWAEDATLDATVPHWRFEREGAAAIAAELSGWYTPRMRIDHAVRTAFPGGETVELDLSWVEDGVPHAAHQVHVLTVDGGRISRDTVFCGGRWSAALLAEMEAARAQ